MADPKTMSMRLSRFLTPFSEKACPVSSVYQERVCNLNSVLINSNVDEFYLTDLSQVELKTSMMPKTTHKYLRFRRYLVYLACLHQPNTCYDISGKIRTIQPSAVNNPTIINSNKKYANLLQQIQDWLISDPHAYSKLLSVLREWAMQDLESFLIKTAKTRSPELPYGIRPGTVISISLDGVVILGPVDAEHKDYYRSCSIPHVYVYLNSVLVSLVDDKYPNLCGLLDRVDPSRIAIQTDPVWQFCLDRLAWGTNNVYNLSTDKYPSIGQCSKNPGLDLELGLTYTNEKSKDAYTRYTSEYEQNFYYYTALVVSMRHQACDTALKAITNKDFQSNVVQRMFPKVESLSDIVSTYGSTLSTCMRVHIHMHKDRYALLEKCLNVRQFRIQAWLHPSPCYVLDKKTHSDCVFDTAVAIAGFNFSTLGLQTGGYDLTTTPSPARKDLWNLVCKGKQPDGHQGQVVDFLLRSVLIDAEAAFAKHTEGCALSISTEGLCVSLNPGEYSLQAPPRIKKYIVEKCEQHPSTYPNLCKVLIPKKADLTDVQMFIKISELVHEYHKNHREKTVQTILSLLLSRNKIEVVCPPGRVDILTETELFENKIHTGYREALGQVFDYLPHFPGRKPIVCLFGCLELDAGIIQLYRSQNCGLLLFEDVLKKLYTTGRVDILDLVR